MCLRTTNFRSSATISLQAVHTLALRRAEKFFPLRFVLTSPEEHSSTTICYTLSGFFIVVLWGLNTSLARAEDEVSLIIQVRLSRCLVFFLLFFWAHHANNRRVWLRFGYYLFVREFRSWYREDHDCIDYKYNCENYNYITKTKSILDGNKNMG